MAFTSYFKQKFENTELKVYIFFDWRITLSVLLSSNFVVQSLKDIEISGIRNPIRAREQYSCMFSGMLKDIF